jgi:hypothetical protein
MLRISKDFRSLKNLKINHTYYFTWNENSNGTLKTTKIKPAVEREKSSPEFGAVDFSICLLQTPLRFFEDNLSCDTKNIMPSQCKMSKFGRSSSHLTAWMNNPEWEVEALPVTWHQEWTMTNFVEALLVIPQWQTLCDLSVNSLVILNADVTWTQNEGYSSLPSSVWKVQECGVKLGHGGSLGH